MSSPEKERETQVYMAKLAEQAERYEGHSLTLSHIDVLLICAVLVKFYISIFQTSHLIGIFDLITVIWITNY